MTAHLPGCFLSEPWNATTNPQLCICDRLRACEQRVRENEHRALITHGAKTNLAGYSEGYAAGLAAARDAVESHFHAGCDSCDAAFIFGMHALAAIDALREDA